MKNNIICILICIFLIAVVLSPAAIPEKEYKTKKNSEEIPSFLKKYNLEKSEENQVSTNLNSDVFGYPTDENPTTTYGFQFYDKEWDPDRGYWRYRFRFDWYQSKFTNGVKDEDSYVYLGVTSTIEEQGIVQGSGNTFDYGAWNLKIKGAAQLNPVASFLCGLVLDFIPYGGLVYSSGEALADALDEPQKSSEGPQWETPSNEGRFIWEADGFFQYDCYIRPNTEYDLKFWLEVYGSCDSAGDTHYNIGWHFWGASPGEGPAELQLTPAEYDFGSVDVGDSSSTKKFILKNVGGQSAYNVERVTHGSFSQFYYDGITYSEVLSSGEEEEIFIRFHPSSSGTKTARLEFTSDNCDSVSSNLRGYGDDCCFPAGTKITMADGSKKNIEDIQLGDWIKSYDIESGNTSKWMVKMLGRPMNTLCDINNGLIRTTASHPFYIQKLNGISGIGAVDPGRAKLASNFKCNILEIKVGDKILASGGELIDVTSIDYGNELVQTYNILSFSGDKTYFANDILVYEEHPPDSLTSDFMDFIFERFPNFFSFLLSTAFFERNLVGS